jgi:hypothetical protein
LEVERTHAGRADEAPARSVMNAAVDNAQSETLRAPNDCESRPNWCLGGCFTVDLLDQLG